jgi:hypothetical protein
MRTVLGFWAWRARVVQLLLLALVMLVPLPARAQHIETQRMRAGLTAFDAGQDAHQPVLPVEELRST